MRAGGSFQEKHNEFDPMHTEFDWFLKSEASPSEEWRAGYVNLGIISKEVIVKVTRTDVFS